MIANILSIAGSDPSGGAGIQADLKTFGALNCHGMAAITALTAQNTRGVLAVHHLPLDFIAAEIDAIFADIRVDAVKIGMLASADIAKLVADRLSHHKARNIVLDPVLVASSGDSLSAPDLVEAIRRELFPLATLVTPNLPEIARFSGQPMPGNAAQMLASGQVLIAQGARAVLVKGGHMTGDFATDVLVEPKSSRSFEAPRIASQNTHGTGCTLSSAIAANLGKGMKLGDAISSAKTYLTGALAYSGALDVGGGNGPVHHFFQANPKSVQGELPPQTHSDRRFGKPAKIDAMPTDPDAAYARNIEELIHGLKKRGKS